MLEHSKLPVHEPETNVPVKFHIYAIYVVGIHGDVNIYAAYDVTGINHVRRNTVYILNKLHFMLLPYITEQYAYHITSICLIILILY